MNDQRPYRRLRILWTAITLITLLMVLSFAAIFAAQPVHRTPAAERWFYANAVINFFAVFVALLLHFRFGRMLHLSTFRTEVIRLAFLQRFSVLIPLYAAALFAAVATYAGGELINLFLTSTFFLAAFFLYPSEKRIEKALEHVTGERDPRDET